MSITNLFITFCQFPKTAIIAVRNDLKKKVYLTYTRDFGSLLNRFKTKYEPILEMVTSVELHEENIQSSIHKLFMKYYQDMYEAMGYEIINKTKYLVYTPKIELSYNTVTVVLVNTRNEKLVCGLFKTTLEAYEFRDKYFNTEVNPYNYPVFADNGNTRKYYNSKEKVWDKNSCI